MNSELINIFNEQREPIGVATREDVHKYGYWHEVFHCWFLSHTENINYIYFQLRSDNKKDYPNLLDITAAGHLMYNETVEDGIREIKEEIGIEVSHSELISLGIFDYIVARDGFIDKELAHVYVHRYNGSFDEFTLQIEEVSGIFIARFSDFYELWMNRRKEIDIQGFVLDGEGNRMYTNKAVGKEQFVPHEEAFYQAIVDRMKEILEGNSD